MKTSLMSRARLAGRALRLSRIAAQNARGRLLAPLLVACAVGACGTSEVTRVSRMPLGPGPEVHLRVPGTVERIGGIAARSPYVLIAWVAVVRGKADVFVAVSRDDGATFSSPRALASSADLVAGDRSLAVAIVPPHASTEPRPPPAFYAVWRTGGGATAGLRVARSTDGGRTFAVADDLAGIAPAVCGVPSLAVTDRLLATWRACGADALVVAAADDDGRWSLLGRTEAEVCECCRLGVTGAAGAARLLWRGRQPDGSFDLMTATSADGGRSFEPPSRISFEWSAAGCEDVAGAVAEDAEHTVHLTWAARAEEPEPFEHVFYASVRGGALATPRQTLDTIEATSPANPQLVLDANLGAAASWDEHAHGVRRVVLRQIVPAHHGPAQLLPMTVLSGTAPASRPVLAKLPGGVIVAWEDGERGERTIAIRRVGLDVVCFPEPVAASAPRDGGPE